MRLAIAALVFSTVVFAQSFDAASVRLAAPDQPRGNLYQGGPGTADPTRFTATNANLQGVIERAFDIQRDQLTAPDWSLEVRVDIAATVPADATKEQFNLMLQHLLAERFHMTYHTAMKEAPAYKMTVAASGFKLKPSTGEIPRGPGARTMASCAGDRLTAYRRTAADIAQLLRGVAGARVIDQTGLAGTYDVELYYAADHSATRGMNCADKLPDAPPPLEAIEKQLGLKLEKTRMMLDIVVIDHLDRAPTDN